MKKILQFILAIIIIISISQCDNKTKKTSKFQINDPFKNTIVPSQSYEIDAKKDNVIEGSNGTVFIFPKGCFINSKGEIVDDNVKVEIAEAFTLDEMILSNLTTTSNGNLLETDGMLYFNVTSNGENLSINKEKPIRIEIPTIEKKAGMMVYKGIRDEKGNMNWVDPKELDNYIIPVDINLLDFLPEGFITEVERNIPYRNYKSAKQNLIDSLYYSLSVSDGNELISGFQSTNYNEPYYNKNKKIVKGKYTKDSYTIKNDRNNSNADTLKSQDNSGINPAIIKVIKSEKYQNTIIATREFEKRLKLIFKTCKNDILEIYIKNLNKNLYELDSIAASMLKETEYYNEFYNLSQLRLMNVKNANLYSSLLKGYYEQQLLNTKEELEINKEKLIQELKDKNNEFEKVADKYRKLLLKREKYRMETYGFEWTETGWINVDKGTVQKDWFKKPLQIIVENGKQFDRIYAYVVYTSINSLYRLNTSDNSEFYVGNYEDKNMLMPKGKLGIAISIGYQGGNSFIAIKEFQTGYEPKLFLKLEKSNIDKIKETIKPFQKYAKENKISKDLEFMDKFFKEEMRQKKLKNERDFIQRLWSIAFPCVSVIAPIEVIEEESKPERY